MRKGNMTILASILAIALVAAGVGAGTLAWFSDTETSTGNVFTAGTLTLEGEPNGQWTVGNMKPEDTIIKTLTVKNTGSLDGYLYGRITYTGSSPDLGTKLDVISWTEGTLTFDPDVMLNVFCSQTGTSFIEGENWMPYGLLEDGQEYTFSITIHWPQTSNDNLYQGADLDFKIELLLHQEDV